MIRAFFKATLVMALLLSVGTVIAVFPWIAIGLMGLAAWAGLVAAFAAPVTK
jgi:hypothetical protein